MGGLLDMPRTAENLIGKKFGRLTVISRAETDKKGVWWNCQCECGNIKQIRTDHLKKRRHCFLWL